MAQSEESAEVTFGDQVKKAREARGWTQDRLRRVLREVTDLDLSSTAMTRLEQGKRPIRLNEVAALAQVLDLSLERYASSPVRLTQQGEYDRAVGELVRLREMEEAADQRMMVARKQMNQAVMEEAEAREALETVRRQLARVEASVARYEQAGNDLMGLFREDA